MICLVNRMKQRQNTVLKILFLLEKLLDLNIKYLLPKHDDDFDLLNARDIFKLLLCLSKLL